jgi:hypothetical protein
MNRGGNSGTSETQPIEHVAPQPPIPRWPLTARQAAIAAFTMALTVGAALRFWNLASKPDWQYDEGVYTQVGGNVVHGMLAEHVTYGTPWQPFLYQPPLYFLALARWFALTGASIYHARILGVLCSLGTLIVLFRLMWRLHGPALALFVSVPVIFDGWLLYIQGVSYIENALLLLVCASILLYQRAQEAPALGRYAVAGAAIAITIAVKYTAAYLILVVLLCWLISTARAEDGTKRLVSHAGHLLLLATTTAVLAAYTAIMYWWFDLPQGRDWWVRQNMVQLRRVLGLQKSGGTLTSPFAAVHLLFAQYRVFAPSFVIAVAAFVLGARLLITCYRARSWAPLQPDALLWSWMAAGIVVFGSSSLRFPQYFALILVPMYCLWWSAVWQSSSSTRLKAAAVGLAVACGITSFWLRVPEQNGNPFRQAQAYAATSIPRSAVVVTEEAIGDLITQRWCRVEQPVACSGVASYAITWKTYLQSSFTLGGAPFAELMKGAVPLRSWSGFSGTATVWRLR